MKILLDENVPHRLRLLLVGHEVYTVSFMKWRGTGNGALLKLAAKHGFDAVLTKDTGMPHEQNTAELPCGVIVLGLASNEMKDLEPLVPLILKRLRSFTPKTVMRIKVRRQTF